MDLFLLETSRNFLDYDMVGKPTPAPRAGCDGSYVGVAALLVVEVDQKQNAPILRTSPDSMRT